MPAIPLELVILFLVAMGAAFYQTAKAFLLAILAFAGGLLLLTALYYPFAALAGIPEAKPAEFVADLVHPGTPTPDPAYRDRLQADLDASWATGDWQGCIAILQQWHQVDPFDPTVRKNLYSAYMNAASAAVGRHEWDAAQALVAQAIDLNPDQQEAHALAAHIAQSRAGQPQISAVQFSGSGQQLQLVVTGTGFGSTPTELARNGDLAVFRFTDDNGPWNAGNDKDSVTLNYDSWNDHTIQIAGFAGEYGKGLWVVRSGDPITLTVTNSSTGLSGIWSGDVP